MTIPNALTPEVSVIFVNWNSESYLREAILSIYQYTADVSFEIIVVDNASSTNAVLQLRDLSSNITIIQNATNVGFAKANNLGFRHSRGRYLLFLNPDTKLVTNALRILACNMTAIPDAGVLGCKLLNDDLTPQTSCIQRFPTILRSIMDVEVLRLRWPGCRLWNIAPLFANTKGPVKVEMISGACIMVRRDVFERIGMFSEKYFMYAEDLELCYRSRQYHYENYFVGEAAIIHYGGKSASKRVNQWSAVMKYDAVTQFLTDTKGKLYGTLFKLSMACVAAFRLSVLGVLSLLSNRNTGIDVIRPTLPKWIAVFKWGLCLRDRVREE